MVVSCSAFACTNRYNKNVPIQFHRFPLRNARLLEKWVHEIKRKNFVPTKYSTMCSEHFLPDDYQIRPGASVRLLKDDAFPSVFVGFPSKFQTKKNPVKPRILQRSLPIEMCKSMPQASSSNNEMRDKLTIVDNKIDTEPISTLLTLDLSNLKKDISTQCEVQSPTKLTLRKKIKILQQRLKRRDNKIKSLKDLIHNIKQNVPSSGKLPCI